MSEPLKEAGYILYGAVNTYGCTGRLKNSSSVVKKQNNTNGHFPMFPDNGGDDEEPYVSAKKCG